MSTFQDILILEGKLDFNSNFQRILDMDWLWYLVALVLPLKAKFKKRDFPFDPPFMYFYRRNSRKVFFPSLRKSDRRSRGHATFCARRHKICPIQGLIQNTFTDLKQLFLATREIKNSGNIDITKETPPDHGNGT